MARVIDLDEVLPAIVKIQASDDDPCKKVGRIIIALTELAKDKNVLTNADRIRGMNDEQLAEVIMCPYGSEPDVCCTKGTCLTCCTDWLLEPAKTGSSQ